MVNFINRYVTTHTKDGEHETANNLHGTFNLADRSKTDSQTGDSGLARYQERQPGDQLPWRASCAQSHH